MASDADNHHSVMACGLRSGQAQEIWFLGVYREQHALDRVGCAGKAWALVVLQIALFSMNVRGAKKRTPKKTNNYNQTLTA